MRWPATLTLIALALALPSTAQAAADCTRFPSAPDPAPERLHHHELDGHGFGVLVPPGYEAGDERYPVLMLLHPAFGNEHSWVVETQLLAFTAALPAAEQAIVVLPSGGAFGNYSDWQDGSQAWETFHLERLLPWVEANYRTGGDPRQRAVAGFSMGGFGAMHYAGRHPELFAAAATFSGAVSLRWRDVPGGPLGAGSALAQTFCGERPADPPAGPFPADEVDQHDPVALAPRYRGLTVQVSAGNGIPCPGELRHAYSPVHLLAEPVMQDQARDLSAALTRAGVEHVADIEGCGLHVLAAGERALRAFWPRMVAAFERERSGTG